MEQYFEIWRDGRLAGVAVGIVQEEYPGIVAFDPKCDIRAGDQLVPVEPPRRKEPFSAGSG